MNSVKQLKDLGQSIWLDYIRRSLITSAELKQLVEEDGVSGITSNPTIFEKAIAGSSDYDTALGALLDASPRLEGRALFEKLAIEDIQMAADVLRTVYDQTGGADGFVSIEVSPRLAHDTAATISEARRLWQAVNRPNLLIKVPATAAGIPAIEALIADSINVNITLMFSLGHYEAVAQAYLRGLARNSNPSRVASVASFFVSRVDTAVDRQLEALGTPAALALRGRIAIANAKRVYKRFREIFYGPAFAPLKSRGARVQRPLWASTGTKNPAYSDVLYVEELIGPDTVNTVPPATLHAFRDHGKVRASLEADLEGAEAALSQLRKCGVDLHEIAEELLRDGVAAFIASFDKLLAAQEQKRKILLAGEIDRESLRLGAFQAAVENRMRAWQRDCLARHLWAKDYKLWAREPVPEITDRLGWLTLPETMHEQLDDLHAFAKEVRESGMRQVVLLGMGGSSLAPEVFQKTFGNAAGHPELVVLDSTHPEAVGAVEASVDLARTLFLVSSKSGTTTETLSFFHYFWQRVGRITRTPGRHFVAITDPATPLERLGRERGFRRTFLATPDVGGRYSALTVFGLVPAALIGVDVPRLLDLAWRMAEACASCVSANENPGLALGAALGEMAVAGVDKVTLVPSSSLESFPAWLEQLIAESTGKQDKGIVPVAEETLGGPESYGRDRVFVLLRLGGDASDNADARSAALEAAGYPVIRIVFQEKLDLGAEFFRWEIAVAAASAVLGIHAFNQPDVELAKQLARKAMAKAGSIEAESVEIVSAAKREELRRAISAWLGNARPGDYVGIQAYLAPSPETSGRLQRIRLLIRKQSQLATTVGYGPRFLHSTGQLHKGGPNTGLFLQIVDEPQDDLAVPETDYTFGALIRAQAVGDYLALKQRGRRVLRVGLGRNVAQGLARVLEVLPS